MKYFMIQHVLLWKEYTNTYSKHNAESSKWLNELIIDSSTDELNIQVNEKFELMPIIQKGGIICLKIMLDEMFFMSEAVVQALNNWLKQFPQEGPSNTVGQNIALLMLQFLTCSVILSDMNKMTIEVDTYLLQGLTN